MKKRRNILLITADQWRGECLSILGHPCLRTPVLDALCGEGTLFSRHYSPATPCGPSRASLFTGLYMHNHRSFVNGTPLDAGHANLALETRKAGYDPVLFGYTDISADPRCYAPEDPALKSYEGILPGMTLVVELDGGFRAWRADLKDKGYDVPKDPLAIFRTRSDYPDAGERGPTYAPALYAAEHSSTAFLSREAIKYISTHDGPWFVHLSYYSPHPPFVAPEPYHDMYDPADVPAPIRAETPEKEAEQHPWIAHYLYNQQGTAFTYGYNSAEHNLTLGEKETRQLRATYYGMMSEVDAQIGRLFEFLKETGVYDETLVIFTSDHGDQLGDHWAYAKYAYFDQTFRVPLIIRDPAPDADGARGRIVDAFTESIDIMPTILEWLGIEMPRECDGRSLLSFCRGATPEGWRSEAHGELDFRNFTDRDGHPVFGLAPNQCTLSTIRDERYKYVHFSALPPLFFDLEKDPGEFHNLADDPAYRDLVVDYAQKMLSWRMQHNESCLTHLRLTPEGVVRY
ncbi:MAG: alkaline phosphatase family protein [Alphaproteobacteria bacterium]